MEKKLIINCDVCDTRKLNENAYKNYESIMINSDIVIVNAESKAAIEGLNTVFNADEFIETEDSEEFDVVSVNGSYTIGESEPEGSRIILAVNGSLTIKPKAGNALKHYHRISVNGAVMCPESLSAQISRISLNGGSVIYPDDCTLLNGDFTIDKYFPLRAAANGKYFVNGTVRIIDEAVDVSKLAEKQVRFKAKKLLVLEDKIEECAPLFDESAEFIVVPNGFSLVDGNAALDEELIKSRGDKIFVFGNLDARETVMPYAEAIKKLIVTGTVTLTKKSAAEFKRINAEYKNTKLVKSVIWKDKAAARLTNRALGLSDDGISVENCGILTIAGDVTPEDILKLVDMRNIGVVSCSAEQADAVNTAGENIGRITQEVLKDTVSVFGDVLKSKVINADKYIM